MDTVTGSATLLQYLTAPNPSLDCTHCSKGTNTINARWDQVTGLKVWTDFDYETLIQSCGSILQRTVTDLPATDPPLSKLKRQIFTERTFETVLERDITVKVSAALRVGWPLHSDTPNPRNAAEIGKGDKASRGTAEEDNRFYGYWAGIRESEVTHFGYRNLCPGGTKLASKWDLDGGKKADRLRDPIQPDPDLLRPPVGMQVWLHHHAGGACCGQGVERSNRSWACDCKRSANRPASCQCVSGTCSRVLH